MLRPSRLPLSESCPPLLGPVYKQEGNPVQKHVWFVGRFGSGHLKGKRRMCAHLTPARERRELVLQDADAGRSREMWGDVGRRGETQWGGECGQHQAQPAPTRTPQCPET